MLTRGVNIKNYSVLKNKYVCKINVWKLGSFREGCFSLGNCLFSLTLNEGVVTLNSIVGTAVVAKGLDVTSIVKSGSQLLFPGQVKQFASLLLLQQFQHYYSVLNYLVFSDQYFVITYTNLSFTNLKFINMYIGFCYEFLR